MMKRQVFFAILMLTVSMAMGDLVGYWTFNEGSGMAAADSSGNGLNGVLYSANSTNYPQWTTGFDGSGSALLFNGSSTGSSNSNRMVVDPNTIAMDPNVPGLGNLSEVFTVSMWVRRDALDYFNNLFPRLVHTSAYDVQLALDPSALSTSPDPYDYFGWTGTSGDRFEIGLETTAQKTLGTWYHLAVTCDGSQVKKYIDGIEIYSGSIPAVDMPAATSAFAVGSKLDNTSYFTGAVDDVAVWAGTYLPAAEVVKLADNVATPLTVVDELPAPPLYPPNYFTKETNLAWTANGFKLLYGPSFSTFTYWGVDDITVHADNTATVWYIKELPSWQTQIMEPGGHYALWSTGQRHWYYFRDLTPENYYGPSSRNVDNFGMAWVDPSWSGTDPNIAKFAVYITPDIGLCIQDNGGYESPTLPWGKIFSKRTPVWRQSMEPAPVCVSNRIVTSTEMILLPILTL